MTTTMQLLTPPTPAREPQRRRWLRATTAAIGAAAVVLAVTGVPLMVGLDGQPIGAAGIVSVVSPPGEPDGNARDRLLAIAATVDALGPDRLTGRYAYVKVQMWAASTTGDVDQPVMMVGYQTASWLAVDGTGVSDHRETEPVPASSFDLQSIRTFPFDGLAGQRVMSTAAAGPNPVFPPIPTDPAALQKLVDAHNGTLTAAVRFVTVAGLLRYDCPAPAARAAILRFIADLPGIGGGQDTIDRLGRPAVGITLYDSGHPLRVMVDAATGNILTFERLVNTRTDRIEEHTAYLVCWRTDVAG